MTLAQFECIKFDGSNLPSPDYHYSNNEKINCTGIHFAFGETCNNTLPVVSYLRFYTDMKYLVPVLQKAKLDSFCKRRSRWCLSIARLHDLTLVYITGISGRGEQGPGPGCGGAAGATAHNNQQQHQQDAHNAQASHAPRQAWPPGQNHIF